MALYVQWLDECSAGDSFDHRARLGAGPQHSQSLHMVAHIPGLKVIMPATPYDAKECYFGY